MNDPYEWLRKESTRDAKGKPIARTREQYEPVFWGRVKIGHAHECWPWMGAVHYKGYGEFGPSKVMPERKAHRIAYTLSVGPIESGKVLMHSCDNPRCCNPAHLSPGTSRENTRDSVRKGRRAPSPTMKLSVVEVYRIREIGNSRTRRSIAHEFGISGRQVLSILRRESWAHLP